MTLCAKLREAVAFFEQPPMMRPVPRLAPPDIPLDKLMREAADEIERLQEAKRRALKVADERSKENAGLRSMLKDIAEFCSGDNRTLGAIERLAHIRNTAARAAEQSAPKTEG